MGPIHDFVVLLVLRLQTITELFIVKGEPIFGLVAEKKISIFDYVSFLLEFKKARNVSN